MSAALALASVFGVNKQAAAKTNQQSGLPEQLGSFVRSYAHGDAKSYGMAVGSGGKKKSNRLRYAHNAKVKRRNAC